MRDNQTGTFQLAISCPRQEERGMAVGDYHAPWGQMHRGCDFGSAADCTEDPDGEGKGDNPEVSVVSRLLWYKPRERYI
jgi:hypothetical protein